MRVEDEALAARGVSAADRAKILDMVQMGFDVAGIFDPTPASDGISGAISLARGDWLGAGISLVSMVPYVGDLAKAGKIGKWAQAVAGGAEMLAKHGAGTALGAKALASLEDHRRGDRQDPGGRAGRRASEHQAPARGHEATIDGAVAKAMSRGAGDAAEAGVETATKRDMIELEAGGTGGWNKQLNGKQAPDTDYVRVKIDLSYGANSKRPDTLAVSYETGGVSRRTVMLNEAPN